MSARLIVRGAVPVARAIARGFASSIATGAVLDGALGYAKDGVRGLGQGVVDNVTLGFGSLAYVSRFGAPPLPSSPGAEIMQGMASRQIDRAKTYAATRFGANLLPVPAAIRTTINAAMALGAVSDAVSSAYAAIEAQALHDLSERTRRRIEENRRRAGLPPIPDDVVAKPQGTPRSPLAKQVMAEPAAKSGSSGTHYKRTYASGRKKGVTEIVGKKGHGKPKGSRSRRRK